MIAIYYGYVNSPEPVPAGPWPAPAILIRTTPVVQVHPGPPFKSPIITRRFSLFTFT